MLMGWWFRCLGLKQAEYKLGLETGLELGGRRSAFRFASGSYFNTAKWKQQAQSWV
jgi:hypothetical protein